MAPGIWQGQLWGPLWIVGKAVGYDESSSSRRKPTCGPAPSLLWMEQASCVSHAGFQVSVSSSASQVGGT